MTTFKTDVRGSTFAREGFAKKTDRTDHRDFPLCPPKSSFGVPTITPKRTRPRTAKVAISVKPRKPIRSDRVRSRSAKSKRSDKHKEAKDGEINADLNFDIEELEKKRNETKKELKSLLKQYLTDH